VSGARSALLRGRLFLERRIVGVAGGAIAVERIGVPTVERRAEPKASRQVRVGDEELAERDRVGFAGGDCRLRLLTPEALVRDIDAAERRLELGAEPRRLGRSRAQMNAILRLASSRAT
jgi:hypothetical protein